MAQALCVMGEGEAPEAKPHCPTCCRLLNGQLVAAKCGHVFHRACLPAVDAPCPTCQEPDAGLSALDLFGLGFGDDHERMQAMIGESVVISEGNREAARKVIALRRDLAEQRSKVEELRQKLKDAKQNGEKQLGKKEDVEKMLATKEDQRKQMMANIEKANEQHRHLEDEVHRSREQSAVVEYRDLLLSSAPNEEALSFLTKMVSGVSDAGPMLTEVVRLRDYHRTTTEKYQSQGVKLSKDEQRNRREVVERQHAVADCKRKLEKVLQLADSKDGELAALKEITEKRLRA